MKLESIKYSQYDNDPRNWDLDELTLDNMNLIVGKNASGKTRILKIINDLALLLRGERKPKFDSANFKALFKHENEKYEYLLCVAKNAVVEEELKINGEIKLKRGHDGIGKIFAQKLNEDMDFQTPASELAFIARQDNIQHPYFEPLYEWAQSVYHYAFGTPLGRDTFAVMQKSEETFKANPKNTRLVVPIFKKGEQEFGAAFKTAIESDLKNIGYDVSDIGVDVPNNIKLAGAMTENNLYGLWVQERDLESRTEQNEISQGMFRALSLIIQINYSKMALKPSCILIDDIGEGLDFERSCALIELLISKAKQSKIQLVMSTNDRFVMNKVPLEVWTVLHREGSHCKVFNIKKDRNKFEEFRFTGLNNFDFFATNYLLTNDKNE